MVLALGLTTLLWACTSAFVVAFQCSIPEPWRMIGNECIDRVSFPARSLADNFFLAKLMQRAFWTYSGSLSILTDAALTVLPIVIIWDAQMDRKVKFSLGFCFGSRAL